MPRSDRSRSERTTEQRERDREERERRRAQRNPGSEPSPTPPAGELPEPEPIDGPTESFGRVPELEPPEPVQAHDPVEHSQPPAAPLMREPFEPPPTEAYDVLGEPFAAAAAEPAPGRPAGPEPEAAADPAPEPAAESQPRIRESAAADLLEQTSSAGSRSARGGWRGRLERALAARPPGRSDCPLGAAVVVIVAIVSLSSGSSPKKAALPAVVNVLIPEGENRLQIAEIAKAKGLTGSYRSASAHSPLLDPTTYGAPKGTPDLEGFLFPATYELDKGAPAPQARRRSACGLPGKLRRRLEIAARQSSPRHPLPAADRRLDGRARGPGAGRPREDRGGHLQPPAPEGSRSASTRRSTTRSSCAKESPPTRTN